MLIILWKRGLKDKYFCGIIYIRKRDNKLFVLYMVDGCGKVTDIVMSNSYKNANAVYMRRILVNWKTDSRSTGTLYHINKGKATEVVLPTPY